MISTTTRGLDLSLDIRGKKMKNPVGVASGTVGYGTEYESLINLDKLGALYTKAVTLHPRTGNEAPRIVETACGILNSIGLANVGVERFLNEKLSYLDTLECAVLANIAGASADEYLEVVSRLEVEAGDSLWGYEINLSCPNVKEGCMVFGTEARTVEQLTRSIRVLTTKPLIVKLTPNVTDIVSIARAAESGGADAVSCINTLLGMVIDVERERPVLPGGTGGLSGPAILPVGIAAVYRVSRSIGIPVIGVGGIASAGDALQYLLAGASAIQIGTANFADPSTAEQVLDGVADYAARRGFHRISDFHGHFE